MGKLLDATGLSLTQALVGLAVLLLLGLAASGWWRVRQLQARRPAAPALRQADPLRSGRIEPALDAAGASAEASSGADASSAAGTAASDPPALRLPPRRLPRLDALIDAIATLPIESPVTADAVWPHLPTSRRAGSKPLLVEGLDAESGHWEPLEMLTPGSRVAELQAGVQLANRSGALNEIEYSEFLQKVQALADALGTVAEAPDMIEVVARARELESLTTPLDAQLTVTLVSSGVPWSLGYLHQTASRAGLVPGALPGRWVRPAREEGAPPIVALLVDTQSALAEADSPPGGGTPQAAVRSCQLVLDVPQSPASGIGVAGSDSDEPFPVWHHLALVLAQALPASIVDDSGEPISPAAFAAIGDEVSALYARLEALDLAAGSAAARRLFS
jgi:hypothetical protein